MNNHTNCQRAKRTLSYTFVKLLLIAIPIIVFFLFNMLTPYWWDDFVMACSFKTWAGPHTKLLENFNDIIISTINMYKTWHGRSVVDFFNFLFMFLGEKTIFNICNTIVYSICVFLMCFHITGSAKKIHPILFLCVNMLLWLFLPQWGQNLLWLTGSINYLWTGTIILFFLIPFRKRFDNTDYAPRPAISILWLFIGIISGWSMENSASGILVLLIAYFIMKYIRKERVSLFEIMGTFGFAAGFFMLLHARQGFFPGFSGLVKNAVQVSRQFLLTDGVLCELIIMARVELLCFRKQSMSKAVYGYFAAALGSVLAMIMPGYFGGRSCFLTQVLLIIVGLSLAFKITPYIQKRFVAYSFLFISICFLSSFYDGAKSIVKSYLLSSAREQYILIEKEHGNMNINVKTPIYVKDAHSGLYEGIDILSDSNNPEYIVHNSAKVTWYGIQSLDGIAIDGDAEVAAAITYYLQRKKAECLNAKDLLGLIYENW